jgi:hypothetical protein
MYPEFQGGEFSDAELAKFWVLIRFLVVAGLAFWAGHSVGKIDGYHDGRCFGVTSYTEEFENKNDTNDSVTKGTTTYVCQ